MCLFVIDNTSRIVAKRLKKQPRFFYKVYMQMPKGIESAIFSAPVIVQKGAIISNRGAGKTTWFHLKQYGGKAISKYEYDYGVSYGIHVFTTLAAAAREERNALSRIAPSKHYLWDDSKVFIAKVTGKYDDFIAAGSKSDAVFDKVYITKKELLKYAKKARKYGKQ